MRKKGTHRRGGKGTVQREWVFLPAGLFISYQEKMSDALPSLSILPRPEDWEVWPEEKGVMVSRSDGERKGKEKNRKWPWGGLQKEQRCEWRSKTVRKNEDEKGEKKDKRCWFNEHSVTLGDIRSSRQLTIPKALKDRFTLSFKSVFKTMPACLYEHWNSF